LTLPRALCFDRLIADNLFFEGRKEHFMKVIVTEQCMGDRNCNELCPEVFEYDEDQLLSIVKMDPIPAEYEEIVRRAAAECGADAIEIIE